MDQPVLTGLFVVEVEKMPTRTEANSERELAMQRVTRHTENYRLGFTEEARRYILEHLRIHGAMSGEELTMKCKDAGIVPLDDRAFGSVYMTLSRDGLIVRKGEAKRLRGHNSHGGSIWGLTEKGRQRE